MTTKEELAFLENDLKNFNFKIEIGQCTNNKNICLSFYNDEKQVKCYYTNRRLYNKLLKKLNVSPMMDFEKELNYKIKKNENKN